MRTLRLPRVLPAKPELVKWNQLLRASLVRLDWGQVQADQLRPEQLDTLFQGVVLSDHFELLGIDDTLDDALITLIYKAFRRAEHDGEITFSRPLRVQSPALPPPEVWVPPADQGLANLAHEEESTLMRKQPELPAAKTQPLQPFSTQKLSPAPVTQKLSPVHSTGKAWERAHYQEPYFSTRSIAIHEVPWSETIQPGSPSALHHCLDMLVLAHSEADQYPTLLQPLISTYGRWIEEQSRHIAQQARQARQRYNDPHMAQRTTSLTQCRTAFSHLQQSLDLLAREREAARAFSMMNRAMWLQRIHTLWAAERHHRGTRPINFFDQPGNRRWTLAQLALILANIADLSRPQPQQTGGGANRDYQVDLLKLPAGWEQGEAYLGLTAYLLGLRRRQHGNMGGINIILRTDAPPLHSGQLQHTATLLCACESIRRSESATWGDIPLRLGIWPGQRPLDRVDRANGHYPNSKPVTGNDLRALLAYCPWCGSPLTMERGSNTITPNKTRAILYCGDPGRQCAFSRAKAIAEGLPLVLSSEESSYSVMLI